MNINNNLHCLHTDIKIDKNFIDGVKLNVDDSSIVEAIITMSTLMGLEVLAEGVETNQQVNFLRQLSTHLIQGYYFSPALNEKNCTDLLMKHVASSSEEPVK